MHDFLKRKQTFLLKLKFLLLATLDSREGSFPRGLNMGQVLQSAFLFCFLCVFINHEFLCVIFIFVAANCRWYSATQFFFFYPVLFFRFIRIETLSLLIDFDWHTLFWKFSTFAVPQGCRDPVGRLLLELPWEVFLEVELLNHRVCVFAAPPASADLFSKVFVLIYSSNIWEFLLLHILSQCLVLLDFLIFADLIGCGMASHTLASSAYLWSLVSWTLFQVFGMLRCPV